MKEQLILSFYLTDLYQMTNSILVHGYIKTGNKFIVQFNGSRGYLSHVNIVCEGYQRGEENTIWLTTAVTKRNGTFKRKKVNIFHSEQNGIRISMGADKPRLIELTTID